MEFSTARKVFFVGGIVNRQRSNSIAENISILTVATANKVSNLLHLYSWDTVYFRFAVHQFELR
jgi:hypothetical protein